MNFLAPTMDKRLRAVGRVFRPGKRICVVAVDIFVVGSSKEIEIATIQGKMLLLPEDLKIKDNNEGNSQCLF